MKKKQIFLLISILYLFLFAKSVYAADGVLYLSPKSGIYTIGSTFSVKVMIDTGGVKINAADAVLNFNAKELEVISISQTNSIFNFWTSEPKFNNQDGLIEFAGGNSKGFSGSDGIVISVTFKALINASPKINFSSGAIMASDGKATNILTKVEGGNYDLEPQNIIPPSKRGEEPLLILEGTPFVPIVFSSTHPNEDAWYSKKNIEFSWDLPFDVTALRLSFNEKSIDLPQKEYAASVKKADFEGVEDGIWYFHIRFKNQYGWGEIAHRKVLIDTVPPMQPFEINIDNEGDDTNPSPFLRLDAKDSLSGISHYEIKVGDEDFIRSDEAEYEIPPRKPGKYAVIVTAVDKAGNSATEIGEFEIQPIKPPIITDYPSSDEAGTALIIKGTSFYPDSLISIFVKKDETEEKNETKTDENGNWSFVYDKKLQEGIYQIWAQIEDERGALSLPTDKVTLIVRLPFFIRIGRVAIDYLTLIVTLAGLVAFLVLIIVYTRNKIINWRTRLKKETKEVAQSLVKGFTLLEKEIESHVEYLDKKPGLSESEKATYDKLKKALDSSRDAIGREIKDIEEELK